jgi:hypothetical protein
MAVKIAWLLQHVTSSVTLSDSQQAKEINTSDGSAQAVLISMLFFMSSWD